MERPPNTHHSEKQHLSRKRKVRHRQQPGMVFPRTTKTRRRDHQESDQLSDSGRSDLATFRDVGWHIRRWQPSWSLCIDIPREPIWKCCPRYVANHVQRRRCRDCWLRNYRLREHLKIPRERTPGSPRPAHCVNAGGDHWGECCVIYRRGELSKHIIDPDWPHQIALPAYRCTGANYVTIHLFCQDLTLCPRVLCRAGAR